MNNSIKSWFKLISGILKTKVPWSIDMQNKDILNVNEMKFNLAYSDTLAEGELAWDPESGTLQVGMPGGVVKGQLLQEMHLPNRPKNIQGSQINNGQLVWGNSGTGNVPEVKLAKADLFSTSEGTIAMATEDVADQQRGSYTTVGLVNGIDTLAYPPGTELYLSDSVAGEYTNVMPSAPSLPVRVGVVLRQHETEGSVYVWIKVLKDEVVKEVTKEPTGFSTPESITSTYDSTARTVTLTGTVNAYWRGTPVDVLTSGWVSDPHPETLDKGYFLLYDGTNFVWQETPWEFYQMPIAFVYYGTTNKFSIREVHGLMPWQSHKHGHETTGTYRTSGGTLGTYVLESTTAANRRPDVAATTVHDEDIPTVVPSLAAGGNYTQHYLTGVGAVNTFNTTAVDIVPLSTNQPYWNQYTGGVWQQTLLGNNNYMCVWQVAVPVTADTDSQKYRYLWVQGQNEHGTLLQAQAETLADLDLGNLRGLFTEFVFINKLIIQYTAANWVIKEVSVLTGTRQDLIGSIVSGIYLSNVTTDSSLSGDGTVANPLSIVQKEKIDLPAWFGSLNNGESRYISQQDTQKVEWLSAFLNTDTGINFELSRAEVYIEDLDTGGTGNNPNTAKLTLYKATLNPATGVVTRVTISTATTIVTAGTGIRVTNMLTNINSSLNTFTEYEFPELYIDTYSGSDGAPAFVAKFRLTQK